MTEQEEKVWRFIIQNRQASPRDVAEATDTSPAFVQGLMSRISSDNWREKVGGVKFDDDKPRMDLIPPEFIEAVANVLTFGARKYSERNWELGMRYGRPYAALMRHMMAWWGGEDEDPETGMPHLWHASCCMAFLVTFEQRGTGTDDRPNKEVNNAGVAKEASSDNKIPFTSSRAEHDPHRKTVYCEGGPVRSSTAQAGRDTYPEGDGLQSTGTDPTLL